MDLQSTNLNLTGMFGLRSLRSPSVWTVSNPTRWFSTSHIAADAAAKLKAKGLPTSPKKKQVPKNERVVMWKMYANFHKHNTICSLVAVVEDLDFMAKNEHLSYNDQVLYYMKLPHMVRAHASAGMLGFRKGQRAEYEAAYQVTTRLFNQIEEKKLLGPNDKVELIMKDFGKGREAFSAALQGKEGQNIRPNIVRVTDATTLKFGGSRSKKLRRLG